MKNKVTIIAIMSIALFSYSIKAQNMVPNYSFEQFDTCPNNENQIQYSIGWSSCGVPGSTPDYYNACSPPDSFGVPYSIFTHQDAHRNCNAYAAVVTFDSSFPNYRELITIPLVQPMTIGDKYFLSYYTVMSEFFYNGIQYGMPSNNIGMRLSTIPYSIANPCPVNNFAHLYSSNIINDSINWVKISGSLIADSTYSYIIIGNFFDDANTDTMNYNCASCLNYCSYYLVDDICVSTDSTYCNGGLDEEPCITLTADYEMNDVHIFPNPSFNFINIDFDEYKNSELEIFNVLGKTILYSKLLKSNKVDLSMLSTGIYFLKISTTNSRSFVRKIIKS